jgi:non-ribosomal peptide synthetase component E (peptide arylation enzyme)
MARPTRYTPEMIAEYTAKGYWTSETMADLWDRNARDLPDKEAIVDSTKRLSWLQAKTWIDRIALNFLELGFKKDEMIVIQLPNCVELCLLRVACEKAGLLFMPVTRNLRHREMEHILAYTEATGIVIPWHFRDFDYWKMIQEIRPNLAKSMHIFVVGDEVPEEAISLNEMAQQSVEKKYANSHLEQTKCQANEFAMVLHTTGTTGFPKFVEFPICGRIYAGKVRCQNFKITGKDVIATLAPAAAGPNAFSYLDAPRAGAKIVMLEHWDAEEALKLIEREKITIVPVVPALLDMILRNPNLGKYDLSSVRFINSTGAPLSYNLALQAEEKIGCPVTQEYGAVDAGGVTLPSLDDPKEVRPLNVGKPYPGNEVKLVNDSSIEIAQGEVGEIMVRGPTLDLAYYLDPESTWQAYTKDGWFNMGDLGKFDDKGNLMIVGRKKDMIIRGGQNVYPVEIENLLRTHQNVSDVAIVGMPDSIMGEKACAYIVPKSGHGFTFDEMITFLKEKNIAPYKLPERLEILDSLPLVSGQKIDKKALQDDILQKLKKEGKA